MEAVYFCHAIIKHRDEAGLKSFCDISFTLQQPCKANNRIVWNMKLALLAVLLTVLVATQTQVKYRKFNIETAFWNDSKLTNLVFLFTGRRHSNGWRCGRIEGVWSKPRPDWRRCKAAVTNQEGCESCRTDIHGWGLGGDGGGQGHTSTSCGQVEHPKIELCQCHRATRSENGHGQISSLNSAV